MVPPLFDSYLYRALRAVERGEVTEDPGTGVMWRRGAEVPARLVDAVHELQLQGCVAWHAGEQGGRYLSAALTPQGRQLWQRWMCPPERMPPTG